jgi:hypothetical protein
MKDWGAIQTYKSGTFPDVIAVDSSGAATPDGTEYIAAQINNGIFGWMQALMEYAGLTPDGVIEAAGGGSQILEALIKGFGVGPGKLVGWFLDDDPSVTGDRVLLLQGQGILHASYPELLAAVYVGDAANAAVAAGGGKFYKSSDAAGTVPDTTATGVYLQLPEARGYALRGFDPSATVDPDGASRFLGDNQTDLFESHGHNVQPMDIAGVGGATARLQYYETSTGKPLSQLPLAISNGGSETRMTNLSIKFGITY